MNASCVTPHCRCTVPFLQAQRDCFLCDQNTPEEEASVQLNLLDGMGSTPSQFLGVSNPVFQRRWLSVTVKISTLSFNLISRRLLLRSFRSAMHLANFTKKCRPIVLPHTAAVQFRFFRPKGTVFCAYLLRPRMRPMFKSCWMVWVPRCASSWECLILCFRGDGPVSP